MSQQTHPTQDAQPEGGARVSREDEGSQPNWKERYRELLEEWESGQIEHREIARIFRNSLTLIKILGQDQHPDIEKNLEQLESLKGKELDLAKISGLLQKISDTIFQLSKDPGHANTNSNALQTKLFSEFQVFLTNVAEQLNEIEQYLNTKGALADDALSSTEVMNKTVRLELSEINDSFDSCTDIRSLQDSVRNRLERIEMSVMDHLQKQESLRHRSAAELERVMDKIQLLEYESNRLRAQLLEERVQAQIDPLTSVYNRKTLDQRLEQELQRCARYDTTLSVGLWDVDSFKSINDKYGHVKGDKVLKAIGAILSSHARKTDMTARFGGEEFVSLLPETGVETARQVLDEVRDRVEQCIFKHRDDTLKITISCGLTQYKPQDTTQSILDRADRGLYEAKERGKNQIVIFE